MRPATMVMRTELPDNAILVCRSIGPTELLDYDRRKLKGLVMEEGSPTMHAAVVAKALDIPVLAQVQGALTRIDALDQIVLVAGNISARRPLACSQPRSKRNTAWLPNRRRHTSPRRAGKPPRSSIRWISATRFPA